MRIVEDPRTDAQISAARRATKAAIFARKLEHLTCALEDAETAARRAGRAFHAAGEALERTR